MLDHEPGGSPPPTTEEHHEDTEGSGAKVSAPRRRRRAASRPPGPPSPVVDAPPSQDVGAQEPAVPDASAPVGPEPAQPTAEPLGEAPPAPRRRSRARRPVSTPVEDARPAPSEERPPGEPPSERQPSAEPPAETMAQPTPSVSASVPPPLTFQPPVVVFQPPAAPERTEEPAPAEDETAEPGGDRRRRRRGGRGRKGRTEDDGAEARAEQPDGTPVADKGRDRPEPRGGGPAETPEKPEEAEQEAAAGTRRRRRRRRRDADDAEPTPDDPPMTVVRVREPRPTAEPEGEVQGLKGSTRLEAKKQRRREGREAGRRRVPILSEAEFLARRESVDRVMVVRQSGERIQIAVLEDGVLVEHYVDRQEQQSSYIGNVYLGRVQNVLPSMEAAFVDIGKGRNAVLYAGEVNWDAAGLEGQAKRIEQALKSGQSVLAQVTKDPIAHKGARLTSQVSLPGRFLVYVPDGSMTGISRKLPDRERARLKGILKRVVPDDAGVIIRTAAEGASEEDLAGDVARLRAQWEEIQRKAKTASPPALLHGEPDLTVRVVRDVFNEDFSRLVVSGPQAWDTIEEYVTYVAPDLVPRVEKWTGTADIFTAFRVDEQIAKALDRKVWLPSGGSLVIERTEAMTVVDVNTGKFTGKGGNLEETVTKNNLEAAEEIVRQLRLRDVGGIIVIDFIDMVLESNRELVLRRLLECLGRDRTKHQVSEVTSLGLVQMTRKRMGQGLIEAYSEPCECCGGRGVRIHHEVGERPAPAAERPARRRGRKSGSAAAATVPSEPDQPASPPPETGDAEAVEPRAPEEPTSVAEALEPEVEPVDVDVLSTGTGRRPRRRRSAPTSDE